MNARRRAHVLFAVVSAFAAAGGFFERLAFGDQSAAEVSVPQFLQDTLVPRVAMGVRRIDAENIDVLQLRRSPDSATPVDAEAPLFRPFFVTQTQEDRAGNTWYLLQDSYASTGSRGWASERDLHVLHSRYAYTFTDQENAEPAELMASAKDSYERLLAVSNGQPGNTAGLVLVRQRKTAGNWRPVTIDDPVPFVELLVPFQSRDREYPDTTPSFRFGIPLENRLIHVAAVCGGPRDEERLRELKKTVLVDKGLEMLFVVDETVSMQPYNEVVARFIRDVGRLAEGRPAAVRIAVCSYTDGPVGARVTIDRFTTVASPEDVTPLAKRVAALGNDLPPGNFANPPERMLEGLRDALRNAAFDPNGLPFVAVIGDTGHEPADPEKARLLQDVAALIQKTRVRTYFMHVGRRQDADEMLFESDFRAVQQEAARLGVPMDQVVYQTAEANTLQAVLERSRSEVEDERRRLQLQIAGIETRTPYTEPGPKLLEVMAKRGMDRERYDSLHLQYFVPSRGWLFQPSSRESPSSAVQFRKLIFITDVERKAIIGLLTELQDRLAGGRAIDGDAAIRRFAEELARAAGEPALESRAVSVWERIPAEQRSIGLFLEESLGMQVSSALTYGLRSAADDRPMAEATQIRLLGELARAISVLKDAADSAIWFDAESLFM